MIKTCKACDREFDAQVNYMEFEYRSIHYCLPCQDHIAEMVSKYNRNEEAAVTEELCRACHDRDTYKGSQYCEPCGDEIGEMMSEYDRERDDDDERD